MQQVQSRLELSSFAYAASSNRFSLATARRRVDRSSASSIVLTLVLLAAESIAASRSLTASPKAWISSLVGKDFCMLAERVATRSVFAFSKFKMLSFAASMKKLPRGMPHKAPLLAASMSSSPHSSSQAP